MNDKIEQERDRILEAYDRLAQRISQKPRFFGYENLAHLMRLQQRFCVTLQLLHTYDYHPLTDLRILDVGCGDGNMLRQFLQWEARPGNLAGIELRPEPVELARALNPALDIRIGSATTLPWPDGRFNLVCQHTVFTSILDADIKRQVAAEMMRVLCSGGAILWYDFMYDNPRNPDVQKVKAAEIRKLFSGFEIHLQRITLAPPIARRLPHQFLSLVYPLLSSLPVLCTHYVGLFIKPSQP